MDLFRRVEALLVKPKEEWVRIKDEPATVKGLLTSYAMILAAVPAVSEFIGDVLIGQRLPFIGWYRRGFGAALGKAVLFYIFSLATVYLFALIINILAPNFSSTPNMINALKLSVYSMTPVWLSGVLYVVPFLGILTLLASLYGLYILYLGFEASLMDTPKERRMPYLAVSILAVIVLYIVFSVILAGIFAVRYRAL